MNIKQALIFGTKELKNSKINSASLDAEILLSWILKKPKEFIYAHPEKIINSQQLTKFRKLINQCAKGMPIAYLTGHKEFYGLDFIVNKNVLIPRPETELLVEEALHYIKINLPSKINNLQLIDIGTGSGCIPIAIAKNLYNVKCIKYYGIDNSPKTLTVARGNAKMHGLTNKIKFFTSDLLKNIPHNTLYFIHNTHLILTTNLPYLPQKLYLKNYHNLKYEPKNSLVAGHDGLKYYRQLLKQLQSLATNDLRLISLFLEINPSQTTAIKKFIIKLFPQAKILIKKDIGGQNRLLIVKLSQKR